MGIRKGDRLTVFKNTIDEQTFLDPLPLTQTESS